MLSAYNILKIFKTTRWVVLYLQRENWQEIYHVFKYLLEHLTYCALNRHWDMAENRLCLLWNLLRSHAKYISILDLYITLYIHSMSLEMGAHPWNGSILSTDKKLTLKSWSTDPDDLFKVKMTLKGHSAFVDSIQACENLIFRLTENILKVRFIK